MSGTLTPQKPRRPSSWRDEPLAHIRGIRNEVADVLSRVLDTGTGLLDLGIVPTADVCETDKTIEVRMDVPGMTAKDIDIHLNQNVLTVSGERVEEHEKKGRSFHRTERRMGCFSRSLTLPCPVIDDEVAAEYKDGVLTITLPKSKDSQARKIEVKQ
jgi:HSP20 family protein